MSFGISTTDISGNWDSELGDSVGNLLAMRIVDDSGRPRGGLLLRQPQGSVLGAKKIPGDPLRNSSTP
eukprot:COSAG03_NODE_14893_length_446_cov_0.882521_1_plen_67_part_01